MGQYCNCMRRPCRCIACDPFGTNYSVCIAPRDRTFDALRDAIDNAQYRAVLRSWLLVIGANVVVLVGVLLIVVWSMR